MIACILNDKSIILKNKKRSKIQTSKRETADSSKFNTSLTLPGPLIIVTRDNSVVDSRIVWHSDCEFNPWARQRAHELSEKRVNNWNSSKNKN